ncbi:UNVERIFIED_CONTAM: hypothetical protein KWE62_18730 [Acinetobacter baumannii]|uniref:hypothetical protein n=1 Tax=Acinetobacter TaxID=469 RepID=UPI0008DC74D6|nr:hypothetical protein [Acinetobacter baumannii]EHU1620051.1 hypothetical protein [Acinetobacter baumannii]MCT9502764.1 hypothetical protein [Acinetobacter baumannii]MDA5047473.1 hypothetical protein [Acinetobacter baumannii]MDC4517069.1 hypothetical protein [Acinetobacter baumannii]MDC4577900.1 hypothetical protein [Acinetobacter baumannii]
MARKFPAINDAWTAFFLCLIVHMSLPLLPLVAEWLITGIVTKSSLTITIAIYAMTIGASSTNAIIAIICIIIGIIFSVLYGVTLIQNTYQFMIDTMLISKIALGTIIVPHVIERYNRHVVDLQPFKILGQK